MFPLKERKVGGYSFGEKTFYSEHHLGTDYHAPEGTPLYAPADGAVSEAFFGPQGGNTVWFRPNGTPFVIRLMHLSRFACRKGQALREGDLIGYTGHTGSVAGKTYAPHLHLDVSVNEVVLAWPGNFVDPETYPWEPRHDVQEGPAVQAETVSYSVPVKFDVETDVKANCRYDEAPYNVFDVLPKGHTYHCVDTVTRQVESNGKALPDRWFKTEGGHLISTSVAHQK